MEAFTTQGSSFLTVEIRFQVLQSRSGPANFMLCFGDFLPLNLSCLFFLLPRMVVLDVLVIVCL